MKTTNDKSETVTDKPKHAGGRPSKYTPELLARAHEYVDGAWQSEADMVPMIVGMCIYCGISEQTANEWQKDETKAEFAELCARVMSMQQRGLVNGGLARDFDGGLTKLLLHKHGYNDKQDVDVTTKGEKVSAPFGFVEMESKDGD